MINVKLTEKSFWDNEVESYLFLMSENLENASDLSTLTKIEEYYPHVKKVLAKHKFTGKHEQSFILTAMHNEKLIEFIFIGLGKGDQAWHVELERLRRSVAKAIQSIKNVGIKSAIMGLPEETPYKISREELVKQLAIITHMSSYVFDTYKTKKDTESWQCEVLLEVRPGEIAKLTAAVDQGNIMGKIINDARHWADTPANIMTPSKLSEIAQKIGDKHNYKTTIFGRDRAMDLGMGAFLSVDAGSAQPCKFVVLEYETKKKNAPTIALVGKGVMYDTGGISLKPASYMTGMKYDMSGAAAVIATMDILGHIRPDVNVVGITPLVENMPSGTASRQDDIVIAMNGKSIEIKNTDAEGRLILADAMCYAEKYYKPDVMIDIATLTGACLYALGYFYSGLMTQDEDLMTQLPEIGRKTGDKVWPLPLDNDFKAANKSLVADVANTGSSAYKAGTITAGCFLSEFVDKARWAHIDIAGTADAVPGVNYLGKTSAGTAIRLLTDFVENFKG